MKRVVLVCTLFCACTKIIHSPPPDGGGAGGSGGIITGGPTGSGGSGGGGPIAHVQMLWQFNLPRTAANLAPYYARFHDNLINDLTDAHIAVDSTGVAPQYGAVQLIWGSSSRAQPSQTLLDTLTMAASSGAYEPPTAGSEAEQINLQQLGANLSQLTIPPQLVNGDSIPLYGPAVDGFIVVTVHSTARLCALGDAGCQLGGSQPVDFFTAVRSDGTASWLQQISSSPGIPMDKVFYVDIVTSEGESTTAFQSRCSNVPGFSRTLLDVIAPSPVIYYNDFKTQATARGLLVEEIDMCDALGDPSISLLRSAAGAITTRLAGQH
jgi:hypothetical protein